MVRFLTTLFGDTKKQKHREVLLEQLSDVWGSVNRGRGWLAMPKEGESADVEPVWVMAYEAGGVVTAGVRDQWDGKGDPKGGDQRPRGKRGAGRASGGSRHYKQSTVIYT